MVGAVFLCCSSHCLEQLQVVLWCFLVVQEAMLKAGTGQECSVLYMYVHAEQCLVSRLFSPQKVDFPLVEGLPQGFFSWCMCRRTSSELGVSLPPAQLCVHVVCGCGVRILCVVLHVVCVCVCVCVCM